MSTVTLTGAALRHEAVRLNIPGRSKMTADQLRAAIGAAVAPVPAQRNRAVAQVPTEAPTTTAPMTPTVFATRWGKRKASLNGRVRRTR